MTPARGLAHAAILACSLLALAGCPGNRQAGAPTDPLQVAAWHGQPKALAATLLMKTTEANGESIQFTLHLWRAADGRTRLLLTKVDVDVLQALVQPDGSFEAWAPRGAVRTRGELADPQLPATLADLRLLISEVCDGPLSPSLSLTRGTHDNVLVGPTGTGLNAEITVDPLTEQVTRKVLRDSEGALVYQLTYARYEAFDDLHRPTKVEALTGSTPGQQGSLVAYLRRFESLGDVSAERMRLSIPTEAVAVQPMEFLEKLDG